MNTERFIVNAENINEIFKNAVSDPTLLSSIDIDHLLNSLENSRNDYLDSKTSTQISSEIYTVLKQLSVSKEIRDEYYSKLANYRYVDELHELHKGKHVRWIRRDSGKLTNGGIVMDIKFLDTGVHILCMNSTHRFVQYKYDECITFQKLLLEEQLILMAYEHMNADSSEAAS